MAVVLRSIKGSELTHNELDNNFSELEERINGKSNISHIHTIEDVSGLQDELDGKIDEGNVNVADGLLRLNSSAKIPCEFMDDCFDVASKVSTSHLFDGNGIIKPELLPSEDCDCSTKQNRLRNYRIVSGSVTVLAADDILIIEDDSILNILSLSPGQLIKIRRLVDSITIAFTEDVRFLDETNGTNWTTGTGINNIELFKTASQWYQIG